MLDNPWEFCYYYSDNVLIKKLEKQYQPALTYWAQTSYIY